MVIKQDNVEAERLRKQRFDGPVSYRDVVSEVSVAMYDRLSGIFESIDFRDCARVVMLGCGSRPFTIFHIHDKTEVADIVGLDIVPDAIEATNALAEKLGYTRIRAELCDGRDYDYSGTQIVYVASMISQKAAVLSRVADTAPENIQIVVCEPCSLGRFWIDSVEHSIDERLEIFYHGAASRTLTRDIFVRRRSVPNPMGRVG